MFFCVMQQDLAKKRYVGVPGMNAICQALSQLSGLLNTLSLLLFLKQSIKV
jgi:hypothetical protein